MNIDQNNPAILQMKLIPVNEERSSVSRSSRISFNNIRIFRQHFEQGSNPLRSILGEDQHQTMIVAMYEGTEKLLNKDVSEFAVLQYLEGLKLAAKELRLKGVSGEKFRISLFEHSASSVRDLVQSS